MSLSSHVFKRATSAQEPNWSVLMKNHHTELVPRSFLTDLSPEAFDELVEQLEFWMAACPEIHPYGSRLTDLPRDWGSIEQEATKG
jgi:hypothetical protein